MAPRAEASRRALLHRAYRFAGAIFEVAQHRLEFLLHLLHLGALLGLAFAVEPFFVASYFLLAFVQLHALVAQFAQLGVELIQKAGNILSLRVEPLARGANDCRIQSQPRCDVNACRRAGHSKV